ncbi:alpha/beta hydrolase [Lacrimispora amygdalina]|uniref:Alpha/beta hydrolase n=1 Tax=Lacrimispora amygdalina TaxID=253257 RepID=A0ABQ5M701_9FIRM
METSAETEKYLNYMDHKIHYEIRGSAPRSVFLIHGWTGSIRTWKYQLDAFVDYKVVAIDLPGNGKSSKDEKKDYTMELFADCIYQVMKEEEISEGFLVGHSMGFAICEIFIQKYPHMCTGICSMDGAHFELPEDLQEKEDWLKFNWDFGQSMDEETGREAFLNMLFLPDTPQMLKDEVLQISKEVPLVIGKSIISSVEKNQKYWAKNRQSDLPCLAIYSPAYQLPPDYQLELKRIYPAIEYHSIADVCHYLMMEIPYRINQIILDFLTKNYS